MKHKDKKKKNIQKTLRKLKARMRFKKKMESTRKRGLKSNSVLSGGANVTNDTATKDTATKGVDTANQGNDKTINIENMETELKTKMDEFTETLETKKSEINDATEKIIPSIITAIETINKKLKTLTTENQEKFYTTQFVVSSNTNEEVAHTPQPNTERVVDTKSENNDNN